MKKFRLNDPPFIVTDKEQIKSIRDVMNVELSINNGSFNGLNADCIQLIFTFSFFVQSFKIFCTFI